MKALGDLSLTNQENEKLLGTLRRMEENKIKADNAYLVELEKNFKLTQQIEKYEDLLLIVQILAEVKKNIWYNINANITELWSYLQIIFEQEELVQNVRQQLNKQRLRLNTGMQKHTESSRC